MNIRISKEYEGLEIKSLLSKYFGYSRANITRLKRIDNGILLNNRRVTVRDLVKEGDVLSLLVEDVKEDENPHLVETQTPIDIVYEDEWCLVVNKPYDMPTIPTHGHRTDTLANAVLYYFHSQNKPFVFRAVNRLDRETSGLVLIAKNKVAAAVLGRAMIEGKIKKVYIAKLHGNLNKSSGEISGYIVRDGDSIISRHLEPQGKDSDYSLTEYKVISEQNNDECTVECSPITGRTHQLRVHFSSIGHPILGDSIYSQNFEQYCRLMLHAYKLSFPLFGKVIDLECSLPF